MKLEIMTIFQNLLWLMFWWNHSSDMQQPSDWGFRRDLIARRAAQIADWAEVRRSLNILPVYPRLPHRLGRRRQRLSRWWPPITFRGKKQPEPKKLDIEDDRLNLRIFWGMILIWYCSSLMNHANRTWKYRSRQELYRDRQKGVAVC